MDLMKIAVDITTQNKVFDIGFSIEYLVGMSVEFGGEYKTAVIGGVFGCVFIWSYVANLKSKNMAKFGDFTEIATQICIGIIDCNGYNVVLIS